MYVKMSLGCFPFTGSHAASDTLALATEILDTFGLKLNDIVSSTQDNASASFNTFDSVDDLAQLPCVPHTIQLFIQHTIEGVQVINMVFIWIHELCVTLRGCNSHLRVEELSRRCTECGIKYLRVRLFGKTRWNSKELMARRFLYLFPAIERFDESLISDKDARDSFILKRSNIKSQLKYMDLALPLMSWLASWTQIISASHTSNIGLVRLFCKRLQALINTFYEKAEGFDRSGEKTMAKACQELYDKASDCYDNYFGENFHGFWIYCLAEFFDCRTYSTLSSSDKLDVFRKLKEHFTTEKENTSPKAYYEKYGRFIDDDDDETEPIALDDDQQYLRSLAEEDNAPRKHRDVADLSTMSLLQSECKSYQGKQIAVKGLYKDPLEFWTAHGSDFPILSRVARVILSIPPAAADTERLFSRSRRVATEFRCSLSPNHVNENVTLHSWLKDEERILNLQNTSAPSYSALNAVASYNKFVTSNVDDELTDPLPLAEDNDDDYDSDCEDSDD